MVRFSFAFCLTILALLVSALCQLHAGQQAVGRERVLTVEEVVKLTRSGFSEDIIVTKIKKNAKPFDLSSDELLDLKKEGVTDNVLKYLLDPSLPYVPPVATPAPAAQPAPASPPSAAPPPKPEQPEKVYPPDPYASHIPTEPGLYLPSPSTIIKVDLKFLLGTEESKSLMKKGKSTGYLVGVSSKHRLASTTSPFYVRLPEGKEIEELVLVVFNCKNGRRELELGPPGPSQQLRTEDLRAKDSVEAGPHLYKVNASNLATGEYLLLFIGSAEPGKGVFGKGYDFGVGSPERQALSHR